MSRLYGTVQGNRGCGSRCGTDYMKVSAQSYEGSVIVKMYEQAEDTEPRIRIELNDDSSIYGDTYFNGTYSELKELLTKAKNSK